MGLSRRSLLTAGAVSVAACCTAGAGLTWLWNATAIDTLGEIDFVNRLAIPPLAVATRAAPGQREFQLRTTATQHDFGAGPVPVWGGSMAVISARHCAPPGEIGSGSA